MDATNPDTNSQVNVAFILTINLDDLSDLPGQSAEISDHLNDLGFNVVSCAPWRRPSLEQGGIPLEQPTTTQQPIEPIT